MRLRKEETVGRAAILPSAAQQLPSDSKWTLVGEKLLFILSRVRSVPQEETSSSKAGFAKPYMPWS